MTRLASFGSIFVAAAAASALPLAYFVTKIYETWVTTIEIYEVKKKHIPQAQTTPLTSSGPIFVVVALPVTYFDIRILQNINMF